MRAFAGVGVLGGEVLEGGEAVGGREGGKRGCETGKQVGFVRFRFAGFDGAWRGKRRLGKAWVMARRGRRRKRWVGVSDSIFSKRYWSEKGLQRRRVFLGIGGPDSQARAFFQHSGLVRPLYLSSPVAAYVTPSSSRSCTRIHSRALLPEYPATCQKPRGYVA